MAMKSEAKIISRIAYIVFLTLSFCTISCKRIDNQPSNTDLATDYTLASHWLNLPATVKEVDVFYLYPTAWHKVNPTDPNICEIDNPSMIIGSNAAFAYQATAFETVGNIYVPYYRQEDAAFVLSLPINQRDALVSCQFDIVA